MLADIDVPTVAEKLFWGAFGHNGQVCLAAKRVYIHSDVYEPLKRALADYAATVRTGNGVTEDVRLGPLQHRPQYARVLDLIRDCEDHGYSFLTGGLPRRRQGPLRPPDHHRQPPEHARIVQEEQFGPVLPLLQFDDIEDAITRANAGDYGLGASVWSAARGRRASTSTSRLRA